LSNVSLNYQKLHANIGHTWILIILIVVDKYFGDLCYELNYFWAQHM